MPFKVCCVENAAQLDSLPVAVIVDYPLEPRDYKPYAQCNICLAGGKNLLLRMWAFEVSPEENSVLRCVFYLFADRPDTAFCAELRANGQVEFSLLEQNGQSSRPVAPPDGWAPRPHGGEDLQGVYWGGLLELPLDWLESLAGTPTLELGGVFSGNFYKICDGPRFEHKGSYFPANFAGDAPYGRESTGEFLVASF